MQESEQTRKLSEPTMVKFKVKCKEMKRIHKLIFFLCILGSYVRFSMLRLDQKKEIAIAFIMYLAVMAVQYWAYQRPILSERDLNTRVILIDKFIFLAVIYFARKTQMQYEEYVPYVHLHTVVALQLSIFQCSTLSWPKLAANSFFNWLVYCGVHVSILGMGSCYVVFVSIGMAALVSMERLIFDANMGQEINCLYSKLVEHQLVLSNILQHLPEGVLIMNRDKGDRLCNSTALKILLGRTTENDDSLICLSNNQEHSLTSQEINRLQIKVALEEDQLYEEHKLEEVDGGVMAQNQDLFESHLMRSKKKVCFLQEYFQQMDCTTKLYGRLVANKKHLEMFKLQFTKCQKTVIFFRDITAIIEKEKNKNHDQMQSILLSSISHDLKTPINSILISNQTLKDRYHHIIDKKILTMQGSSCLFMLSLINDITDLTKFQLNKFELNPSEFSLESLVSEAVTLVELKIQEKKLQFKQVIDPLLPRQVCLDRKRLQQIINNLLSNAIKFTLRGKITLRLSLFEDFPPVEQRESLQHPSQHEEEKKEVDLSPRSKRFYLKLEVEDTGVGISERNQRKLFKLFGMVRKNSDINPNGTGLGLTICKRLAEAMDGFITVRSAENIGSVFTVCAKLNDQVNWGAESYLSSQPCSSLDTDDCVCVPQNTPVKILSVLNRQLLFEQGTLCQNCSKILIIDDDSFNVLAIELLLNSMGKFDVDSANSGTQGIALLQEKLTNSCKCPYEIVFVDLNMPLMNGDEMMRLVKRMIDQNEHSFASYRDTRFILCTAQSESSLGNYKGLGFESYLEKPIMKEQLAQVLHQR